MPRQFLPLFGLVLLSSCIIRPQSSDAKRRAFDRSALVGSVILPSKPSGLSPSSARWEDGIQMLGWSATPLHPNPGERVTIDYVFEVLEPPTSDWKLFVHLEPQEVEGGRINGDHDPVGGHYPTSVWQQGEIVRDRWSFTLPSYLETPGIELWTGFYRGNTRLTLLPGGGLRTDGKNRAVIGVLHPAHP